MSKDINKIDGRSEYISLLVFINDPRLAAVIYKIIIFSVLSYLSLSSDNMGSRIATLKGKDALFSKVRGALLIFFFISSYHIPEKKIY